MKAMQLLLLVVYTGCGSDGYVARRKSNNMNDYVATVRSARSVLPIAVQMEELFPVADHFITEYAFASGPRTWNTEVFFGGRYTLTMQVDIEIDYKADKIVKVVGEPKFYLNEVLNISILPEGRTSGSYNSRNHRKFGSKDWQKIYEGNGDLSPVGVKINPEATEHWDEYVSGWRRDRIPVSLLDK